MAEPGDVGGDELSADQDLTSTLQVPANGSATVRLNAAKAGNVSLVVDCNPPADPDSVGPVVKVSAPDLGVSGSDPARAGYWGQAISLPAGQHSLTIANQGGAATCKVRTTPIPATQACKGGTMWRSPNTDHTHLHVGSEAIQAGWEAFPASGNHWGAWAAWNKDYAKPIKQGFLLHNLEHGGLVFSYKCNAATDSAACKSAHDALASIAHGIGPRVLITPDPTQPQMFAVRGWRYAYSADCLDTAGATAFAKAHYRHGREDADADPPIPFDPTTTNVPCQDLMAAPDSCN